MKKVSCWEQVLGRKIDSIEKGTTFRIYLDDAEWVLQLETDSEAIIGIAKIDYNPMTYEEVSYSSLYNKTIKKVVVPFFDIYYHDNPEIRVGFDEGPDVLLIPDDLSSTIRIT